MEERTLTRKDLRRCWRAWMMHNLSSMSFERLESFGFCLSMLPVAKKLYPDAAQRTEMLRRHASFYNTEPQIGAIVNGMVLGLEEKKANGEPIDGETINTLKVGLMGPIAGIGDSMIPGMLIPILLSIGMALAAGVEKPYVGNLPVKHLQRFLVTGYVPPAGAGGAGGAGGAAATPPAGSRGGGGTGPAEVFANTASPDTIDVVHFTIELVVEARRLPEVIAEICKAGFYTPLLVNIQEQPSSPVPTGYIYGSAPTVLARLMFEGGFLRSNYSAMLPEKVKKDILTGAAYQGGQGAGAPSSGGGTYGPMGGGRGPMMGPEGPGRRGPGAHGRPTEGL